MEIKRGVVVFYIGINEAFPRDCDWKKRIGVVLISGIYSASVKFIGESRNICTINMIPLFMVSSECENWKDPLYVIDIFKDQIIESLARIFFSFPSRNLLEIAKTAQEVCEQTVAS
mgnify:CR=1 FL=1